MFVHLPIGHAQKYEGKKDVHDGKSKRVNRVQELDWDETEERIGQQEYRQGHEHRDIELVQSARGVNEVEYRSGDHRARGEVEAHPVELVRPRESVRLDVVRMKRTLLQV